MVFLLKKCVCKSPSYFHTVPWVWYLNHLVSYKNGVHGTWLYVVRWAYTKLKLLDIGMHTMCNAKVVLAKRNCVNSVSATAIRTCRMKIWGCDGHWKTNWPYLHYLHIPLYTLIVNTVKPPLSGLRFSGFFDNPDFCLWFAYIHISSGLINIQI